jgi:hypothetical protein
MSVQSLSSSQVCLIIKTARHAGVKLSVQGTQLKLENCPPGFADSELYSMLCKHGQQISLTVMALDQIAQTGSHRENF